MALHRLHGIMGDTPYRIVTISVRIKPKQRPPRQNAYLDNIYAWQGLPPVKSTEILDEPDSCRALNDTLSSVRFALIISFGVECFCFLSVFVPVKWVTDKRRHVEFHRWDLITSCYGGHIVLARETKRTKMVSAILLFQHIAVHVFLLILQRFFLRG